jgi:cytoskeletal protein RodZ
MDSPSGPELKKLRESKNLTLDDAVQGTRLRLSIITAIEDGGACDSLASIYQGLSLRTYARYLENAEPVKPAAAKDAPAPPAAKPAAKPAKP